MQTEVVKRNWAEHLEIVLDDYDALKVNLHFFVKFKGKR